MRNFLLLVDFRIAQKAPTYFIDTDKMKIFSEPKSFNTDFGEFDSKVAAGNLSHSFLLGT